ncbi:uncharacterized protein LOC126898015 [Daktulosphaira vitifoliae]|uniref:uncharacterized protein LOC126898015 n=1 Tax=Daktulosphaira vitifoliae TaxID=58002 RepID=UPI0021AA59F5|nr:uncharacterized protein LOC126898015 [Daktulosphaira vitifoliae]
MATDYTKDFIEMVEVSKTMLPLMRDMDERAICEKWISRAKSLQSRDVNVLKHRNNFMKYFLGLIKQSIAESGQTPSCCKWGKQEPSVYDKPAPLPKPLPYQCHWTPDKRTYVAIQPLPNRGAMVYMAVAEKPELGWEFPSDKL